MNNKFPCICGHLKSQHNWFVFNYEYDNACDYCYERCLEYKPDNLKYLEQIYSNKVKK
jgi:hypothetical protein